MSFPTWAPWSTRATRESVYQALFQLLQTVPVPAAVGGKWNTQSRVLQDWEDVVPANQPAMFLHQLPQNARQPTVPGLPEWRWHAALWIYYRTDNINNPTASNGPIPDAVVNAFVDNVELALQSVPPEERQTLGGRVVHTWIEGDVVWNSGLTNNQAVILVPITVMVAI